MAGWTITDWDGVPAQDWAHKDNVYEFQTAVNERRQIVGATARSVPGEDDDVQGYLLWQTMQADIESACLSFAVSHDAGVYRGSQYFDNKNAGPAHYADFAALLVAAGLGAGRTHWRRYTTHPDDGGSDLGPSGTVAESRVQEGDILGPWIFEDIQRCLNAMVWTYKQTVDTAWTYTSYNEEFGEGADNDWEVAKDEAEADAAVDQDLAYPLVITRGETVAPPLKSAQIRDTLHKLQVTNIPTPCNHVCEYYIKVDMVFLGTLQFDTYSRDVKYDPVTPQELWSCFDESASNSSAANTSAFIGRNDLAAALAAATETWCGDPATSSYDGRGWRAKDAGGDNSRVAVIRWDVTNGLEYY